LVSDASVSRCDMNGSAAVRAVYGRVMIVTSGSGG